MTKIYVLEQCLGPKLSDRKFREFDIQDDEAERMIERDYQIRVNGVSVELKETVTRRTCQEIIDEMNRQYRNDYIKQLKHYAPSTKTDKEGNVVSVFDIEPDTGLTPEEYVNKCEEQEMVDRFIATLTGKQKERLLMRLDGMSVAEIARAEGSSFNTVKESLLAIGKKYQNFLK